MGQIAAKRKWHFKTTGFKGRGLAGELGSEIGRKYGCKRSEREDSKDITAIQSGKGQEQGPLENNQNNGTSNKQHHAIEFSYSSPKEYHSNSE